jgi:hypothetical protein
MSRLKLSFLLNTIGITHKMQALGEKVALFRRADARRLGGPAKPGHDNF